MGNDRVFLWKEFGGSPDWAEWNMRPVVRLWEAAVLSVDVEPLSFVSVRDGNPVLGGPIRLSSEAQHRSLLDQSDLDALHQSVDARIDTLLSATAVGLLGPVLLADSREYWKGYLATDVLSYLRRADVRAPRDWKPTTLGYVLGAGHWPWGDYDTKLLRVLAEAVHEWWSTYDAEDSDTAPLQSEVTAWIEKRLTQDEYQNPGTLAGYMATIIRHEKAPVGRRKKSRSD